MSECFSSSKSLLLLAEKKQKRREKKIILVIIWGGEGSWARLRCLDGLVSLGRETQGTKNQMLWKCIKVIYISPKIR